MFCHNSTASTQIMKSGKLVLIMTGCILAFCSFSLFYRLSARIVLNETDEAIGQSTSKTSTSIVVDTKQDVSTSQDSQAYTAAVTVKAISDFASTTHTGVQSTEDNHSREDCSPTTATADRKTAARFNHSPRKGDCSPTTATADRKTAARFNHSPRKGDGSPTTATADRKTAARFLYLVQTESCLPPDQTKNESLGNGSLHFHVLVLSYKNTCDDHSLSHVEYVFDASTTWTTGRNLLFTLAMKRNITYLYYIFMDDDATAKDIRTNALAWRAFEGFLQSMEPAVMALDLPGQDYSENVLQIHKNRGCVMDELEYVTGLWYDAMVNAFHYKAIKYLLPYISEFDQQTWWASQMALIVRTEILFRGQLLLHRYIRVTGSQHRPYPRDLNFPPNMYSRFTQGLDAHFVPGCVAKCAQIMIDRWIKFGNANGWSSSTLCLPPPPPRDPVEPCRYQCYLV